MHVLTNMSLIIKKTKLSKNLLQAKISAAKIPPIIIDYFKTKQKWGKTRTIKRLQEGLYLVFEPEDHGSIQFYQKTITLIKMLLKIQTKSYLDPKNLQNDLVIVQNQAKSLIRNNPIDNRSMPINEKAAIESYLKKVQIHLTTIQVKLKIVIEQATTTKKAKRAKLQKAS